MAALAPRGVARAIETVERGDLWAERPFVGRQLLTSPRGHRTPVSATWAATSSDDGSTQVIRDRGELGYGDDERPPEPSSKGPLRDTGSLDSTTIGQGRLPQRLRGLAVHPSVAAVVIAHRRSAPARHGPPSGERSRRHSTSMSLSPYHRPGASDVHLRGRFPVSPQRGQPRSRAWRTWRACALPCAAGARPRRCWSSTSWPSRRRGCPAVPPWCCAPASARCPNCAKCSCAEARHSSASGLGGGG